MANVTPEEVLEAVRMLPPEDQRKLRDCMDERSPEAQSQIPEVRKGAQFPYKGYDLEYRWLREHGAEHSGQWVALDGDRLVSTGIDVREVHKTAQAAGVAFPYLVRVDAKDDLPFGGW